MLSEVLGMTSLMIDRYTVKDRRTVTARAIFSPDEAGSRNTRTFSRDSITTGMIVFKT